MYNPTFAISFINTETGNGIIDAGTSDLKTAKGAARNWYKNVGHVIDSWVIAESKRENFQPTFENISIIMRPITDKGEAISHNIETGSLNAERYIAREISHGATILSMDDLF